MRKPPAVSFHLSLSTESVMAAYPEDPLIVAPEETVGQVLQIMSTQKTGSVLVCDDNGLLGIFTDRDALRWMADQAAERNPQSANQPISKLMTPQPTSLPASTSVGEAIQLMSSKRYRHLPIIGTNGMPTGLASANGIVHYLVDHFPQTIYTLPPQPGQIPSEREGA